MKHLSLQVGVKILIRDKSHKWLLLRRSLEKYPDVVGRWDIPGGRIEPGASLLKNLQREVKEETELDILGVPQLIAAQDILNPERHVVRLTYVGYAEGNVQLDGIEHDEFLLLFDDIGSYLKELIEDRSIHNKLKLLNGKSPSGSLYWLSTQLCLKLQQQLRHHRDLDLE